MNKIEILKSVIILTAAIALTGCSAQDNNANKHSTDSAKLVAVDKAYQGCDELLGERSRQF